MNTDKTFEFYLKKDDSTYFAVKDNVVIETATKTPLRYSPSDWADALVASKISGQEWIATREYTEPLKFVLDGADIIRHIMYTNGFTSKCIFLIEKLNTYNREYFKWYEGNIDISNCKDEDDFVNANVLETNLIGLIRNREDIPYEIDLYSGLLLYLDGVKLGASLSFILGDSTSGGDYEGPANSRQTGAYPYNVDNGTEWADMDFLPATSFSNNVQAGTFVMPNDSTFDTPGYPSGGTGNAINFKNPNKRDYTILRNTANWYNVRFSGNLSIGTSWIKPSGSNITQLRVHVYIGTSHPDGARVNTVQIGVSEWFNEGSTMSYHNILLSGTLQSIDSGLDMFIFTWLEASPAAGNSDNGEYTRTYFIDGSNLKINYQAKVQNTTTRVLRYIDFSRF